MNLIKKCGTAFSGLFVSLGCLATEPPCWKLELEGAAPGDVCWFSDQLASGTVYSMNKVIMKNGQIYCFHEGDDEDRFVKKFGWLNADWESLRAHFSAQQSIRTFIGSYKWCSDNNETKTRPLPKVCVSEVSEETVHLETVIDKSTEYLSLGILSGASGKIKSLGRFYKECLERTPEETGDLLSIVAYVGCGWAVVGSERATHNPGRAGWTNECFSAHACSVDGSGYWKGGTHVDFGNCDGNKNAAFEKIKVSADQLPDNIRKFYEQRQ